MFVKTFPTTEAFFEALLGPAEPNAHVIAWRQEVFFAAQKAGTERFAAQMEADKLARREARAHEIAEQYAFNPTSLRVAHDRWATGCFSHEAAAPVQTAIHLRALDIALARANREAA